MEGLLLHCPDHHRHCGHNCDQQPVRFQTVDDRIAGKDTRNVKAKMSVQNQFIRLAEMMKGEGVFQSK